MHEVNLADESGDVQIAYETWDSCRASPGAPSLYNWQSQIEHIDIIKIAEKATAELELHVIHTYSMGMVLKSHV